MRRIDTRVKPVLHRAKHRFRRHARDVWKSRGGGFYGFVATLMFLYLEGMDLAGDIASLPGFLKLDVGWIIGWFVNNAIDAVHNLILSVIWPVQWISRFGVTPLSLLLLAACYGIYRLVRPWVLRMLEDPVPEPTVQTPPPGP